MIENLYQDLKQKNKKIKIKINLTYLLHQEIIYQKIKYINYTNYIPKQQIQ